MSGSQILSAITAAGQLFAGYGTVTLGPVKLTGLSLPPAIQIGGKQHLMVSTLPGGAVVVNAMGPVFAPKEWSGYLDGQNASQTARTLEKMWKSGASFKLAWDVYSYQVVIEKFTCDMRLVSPLKYSISCLVLQDNSAPKGKTLISMALQVASDIESGNYLGALSSVSGGIVGSSITNALSSTALSGAMQLGSEAYNTAVSAINTASTAINSAMSYANGVLAPLGTSLGDIANAAPAALDAVGFAGQLSDAVSAAGDMANLAASSGYLARVSANMAQAIP